MSLLTIIGVGVIAVLAAFLLLPRGRTRRIGMSDDNPHNAPSPRSIRQPDEAPEADVAQQPAAEPLARLTPEQAAEIDEALDRRRKIEAIKLYREWSGLGLREAKEAVEAYERRR